MSVVVVHSDGARAGRGGVLGGGVGGGRESDEKRTDSKGSGRGCWRGDGEGEASRLDELAPGPNAGESARVYVRGLE